MAEKEKSGEVKLLSGGNPQIPKGDGDGPVQAYIAAMPGWKHDIGAQLDLLIEAAVPGVRKAVKWNTPFYGVQEGTWFTAFHCFDRYVKITFFDGDQMDPVPPVASKQPRVRYLHASPEEPLDEAQFTDWIRQAAALPGEKL